MHIVLSGTQSTEQVQAFLRALPRALPRRDDRVLARGSGPAFTLTRWRVTSRDVLLPRVRVVVGSPSGTGCTATVSVRPSFVYLAVVVTPLLPLVAAAVPTSLLGVTQRLFLLGMAVFLAALFAFLAWADVPEYETDRDALLAYLRSAVDATDLPADGANRHG